MNNQEKEETRQAYLSIPLRNDEQIRGAARDLYHCCLSALGVYEELERRGIGQQYAGFGHTYEALREALKKAGYEGDED